ncbi:MAG: hypothetical protein CMM87_00995 [Rickettsiales bacterium]|nr:hypothetical protein [Rickettsiales bacterium]
MDVTQEIQLRGRSYSTGTTNPSGLVASRSLQFAKGPTMDRAVVQRISAIPQSLVYEDTVGLFGTENQYVRFELNAEDILQGVDVEDADGYRTVLQDRGTDLSVAGSDYDEAVSDDSVQEDQSVYARAVFTSLFADVRTTLLSIDLTNLRTGNMYIDNWVDVRLYDSQGRPHEYDKMYITPRSSFTLGIHARKANRLPFRLQIDIGFEILSIFNVTEEQRRYMPG